MIEVNKGIRSYKPKGIFIKTRKNKPKLQPRMDLEKIDGWYMEGYFIKTGMPYLNRADSIHYFYKSLKPICNSPKLEDFTKLIEPNKFAIKNRKCKMCLRILATYSDLSLRVLK